MAVESPHRATVRSLAATLGFVLLGSLAFGLLQQISGLVTLRDFRFDPLRSLRIITLYYWLPWLFLAPFVALCSARFPIRPNAWAKPLIAHALLLLGLSFVHALVIGYIYHYSGAASPEMATYAPWQHSGHFLFGDDMLLFDAVTYAVFAATLNIRKFQAIVRQQDRDADLLNQQLTELRLQTLRMQVNPHFLFNALNAIAVLVRKGDAERAGQTITLLSRFFRQTLASSEQHWLPLEDELEMVRQYLSIAQVRFGERLTVHERCDPALRRVAVPAMLLQPLVENAVIHGLGDKVGPCELRLDCRAEGERLRIEIADNGVGGPFYADPDFEEGVGLKNVRGRLAQFYGDAHAFELASTPGRGTRITIDLPLRPATPIAA